MPSAWLRWLKTGFAFSVAVDETGKTYPATVVRTGARVDPVSQSIKVIGRITENAPELIPGMSGPVDFERPPSD